jgi:energy-coupling factor transport system ATP-binding protein
MIGGTKERKSAEYDVDLDIEKSEVVENMAKLVHIEDLMEQHPYDLSGGEQQRLAMAKILLLRPKILLMDEPTKGLDSHFKMEFASIIERLKKHGVTIFMISHDIEFCAEYADRCGLMFDGNIVTENTPVDFFAGNSFYTTSANRMARHLYPDAITGKDVVQCLTNS